jgi:hypothetical protein
VSAGPPLACNATSPGEPSPHCSPIPRAERSAEVPATPCRLQSDEEAEPRRARLRGDAAEVSWLLRTKYISAEAGLRAAVPARGSAAAAGAAKGGEGGDGEDPREARVRQIEAQFAAARRPLVHGKDPALEAVEVLPGGPPAPAGDGLGRPPPWPCDWEGGTAALCGRAAEWAACAAQRAEGTTMGGWGHAGSAGMPPLDPSTRTPTHTTITHTPTIKQPTCTPSTTGGGVGTGRGPGQRGGTHGPLMHPPPQPPPPPPAVFPDSLLEGRSCVLATFDANPLADVEHLAGLTEEQRTRAAQVRVRGRGRRRSGRLAGAPSRVDRCGRLAAVPHGPAAAEICPEGAAAAGQFLIRVPRLPLSTPHYPQANTQAHTHTHL